MNSKRIQRLWSALLATLLLLQCVPVGAVRAELTDSGLPTETTLVTESSVPTEAADASDPTETTAATQAAEVTDPTQAPAPAEAESTDGCPYCEETLAEDGTVIHGDFCTAPYVYDGTADVGKYVRLIPEVAEYGVFVSDSHSTEDALNFYYDEFGTDTVMRITDWYWDPQNTDLWYRVELYSGAFPESTEYYTWPDPAWILQDYTNTSYEWDAVLEFTIPETPDTDCPICGKEDCNAPHLYCSLCDSYDCGLPHPYCGICEIFDCTENHTWCGSCGRYDCGLEHEDLYTPIVTPVIPENPTLDEGKDVSILNENGQSLSETGLTVNMGSKISISAWSAQGQAEAYQWQIRYDKDRDLWVDIYAQTGKGLLVSPALFLSLLDREPALRCAITVDQEQTFSDPIPLALAEQITEETFASDTDSEILPLAEEDEEDTTVNVLVEYLFFKDGTIAANPRIANLPKGVAYAPTPFNVPTIMGYTPVLDVVTVGDVTLEEGQLTLSFTAEEMNQDRVITVYYHPAPVTVTVRHMWQNLDNDEYTEHLVETLSLVTGTEVGDVHKIYPGFDQLAYDKPTVAADGSTEIKIYYDRQYYLITFELSGGYGVLPVYARYDTKLQALPDPIRAGYKFLGWDMLDADGTGDGNVDLAPTVIPNRDVTYRAMWEAQPSQFTVVYWRENADDIGYSYWDSVTYKQYPSNNRTVYSGEEVSALDYTTYAGLSNAVYFTYNPAKTTAEEASRTDLNDNGKITVAGDGSTVLHVYYSRNYYTIYFQGYGTCAMPVHTHGTDCEKRLLCGEISHIHDDSCVLTLTCPIPEHTAHTPECTICTDEVHTHDDTCLNCTGIHVHTSDCCTVDEHSHSILCYSPNTGYVAASTQTGYNTLSNIDNPNAGYVYRYRYTEWWTTTYYNYFYDGTTWYYLGTNNEYRGLINSVTNPNQDGRYTSAPATKSTSCGKTAHDHTSGCFYCNGGANHTPTADCCTVTEHVHTIDCYTMSSGTLASTPVTNQSTLNTIANSNNRSEYGVVRTGYQYNYSYYIQINGSWYQITNINNWQNAQLQTVCAFEAHTHGTNCEYCCKPVHSSHDASCWNCDGTEHTHDDTCFTDSLHTHTGDCYTCDNLHVHTDSCYGECLLTEHKHGNNCNSNNSNNIIYVITAKYEQNISELWPTYDILEKANSHAFKDNNGNVENANNQRFRGWDVPNADAEAVSKRVTMTDDLCDTATGSQTATAKYSASYDYHLHYMFESFDQSSPASGDLRRNRDNKYFDSDKRYEQELSYSSETTFGQKPITGMNAVGVTTETRNGVIYNFLYYTRNRFELKFRNVNVLEHTVQEIMYELPLKNVTLNGAPASEYVPPYPDGYEAGAYEFTGWYTTPECYDGTEVDWNNITMPNSDLELFAKWEPIKHDVTVYRYRNKDGTFPQVDPNNPDEDDVLVETMQVPHGQFVQRQYIPPDPANGFYIFDGWFYIDTNGKEQAFSFEDIPVTQDLEIYAKWGSNVPCPYEIRFVLASDNSVEVAPPITGSILQNSKTFDAKAGQELYEAYRDGYFPDRKSHTITPVYEDTNDDGNPDLTVYLFEYTHMDKVPYTVRYWIDHGNNTYSPALIKDPSAPNGYRKPNENETGEEYYEENLDNTLVQVTEQCIQIPGYSTFPLQKTLVLSANGTNEIIFYYTVNTTSAQVIKTHYIQNTTGEWTAYLSSSEFCDIGGTYSESAIDIKHYSFSDALTDQYNMEDKKDALLGTDLLGDVKFDSTTDTVSGVLTANGLQLNLYYIPNTYSYTVRYLDMKTLEELEPSVTKQATYNSLVTEEALTISKDLDNDGQPEDFRLYDASKATQQLQITQDGLEIVFYYVRCTKDLAITKRVEDTNASDGIDPDPELSYNFKLTIQVKKLNHEDSYPYEIRSGETLVSSGYRPVNGVDNEFPYLTFSLKKDQTITIFGLPTAEYTLEEEALPLGYESGIPSGMQFTLEKENPDNPQIVTVTNKFVPATLKISKTVNEEEISSVEGVEEFVFTVDFPADSTPESNYSYTVSWLEDGKTEPTVETRGFTVTDRKANFRLKDGETAWIHNLPLGEYTVTESEYEQYGYDCSYSVNGGANTNGRIANVELKKGEVSQVDFQNLFPVGDLKIQKTVTKEFSGTEWAGDSFQFTVIREGKVLVPGKTYTLLLNNQPAGSAMVNGDNQLIVTIDFAPDQVSIAKTLTIQNLPLGTYTVTEATDNAYNQTPLTVTDLELINGPTAKFTNQLRYPRGNLYLSKLLEREQDYTGPLSMTQPFSFSIQLQGQGPTSAEVQVFYNGDTDGTKQTLNNGALTVTLKANEYVNITGLPVGTYRITEATVPQYANVFAQADSAAGPWTNLDRYTHNGSLYTDVQVTKDGTAYIQCTNIYPVNTAHLIIHKLVTNLQPQDPTDEEFTFTVTLTKNEQETYLCRIYDKAGAVIEERTVTPTDNKIVLTLKDGQYAYLPHLPAEQYTVAETPKDGYNTSYQLYLFDVKNKVTPPVDTSALTAADSGTGTSVTRIPGIGSTELLVFTNQRGIDITYHSNYPTELSLDPESAEEEKTFNVDYTIKGASIGETTFEAEGYVLESWNTQPDGSGTRYEINDIYKENQDLTLYAQWVDARLTVPIFVGINMQFYKNGDNFYYTFPKENDVGEPVKTNVDAVRVFIDAQDGNTWKISKEGYHDENNKWVNRWGHPLPGEAMDYIKNDIFTAEGYTEQAPHCPGIFDSTGAKTKALLNFDDDDYTGIIEAWILEMKWLSDHYPNTNVNWDSLSKTASDYEVIPYVIKKHENGSLLAAGYSSADSIAWHVDLIIVPKVKYTVTYVLGLKDGYTATVPVDPNQYGKGYYANVQEFHDVTNTNDNRYVAKFLGWEAKDEFGNPVKIEDGKINMPAANVILTAKWEYPVEYTVKYHKKDPITGNYVYQTGDDEEHVVYIGETAQYSTTKYDDSHFVKVDPTDLEITQDGQVFDVYYDPNTLTIHQNALKDNESAIYHVVGNGVDMYVEIQGGNSVTIEQICAGDYTITELTNWTWQNGSTANSQSVKVNPGNNKVTFNYSQVTPDWLSGESHETNKFT